MKCQILFVGENMKNITCLLSAETVHCMVSVDVFPFPPQRHILWVLI